MPGAEIKTTCRDLEKALEDAHLLPSGCKLPQGKKITITIEQSRLVITVEDHP
jgi:hypothetical protein